MKIIHKNDKIFIQSGDKEIEVTKEDIQVLYENIMNFNKIMKEHTQEIITDVAALPTITASVSITDAPGTLKGLIITDQYTSDLIVKENLSSDIMDGLITFEEINPFVEADKYFDALEQNHLKKIDEADNNDKVNRFESAIESLKELELKFKAAAFPALRIRKVDKYYYGRVQIILESLKLKYESFKRKTPQQAETKPELIKNRTKQAILDIFNDMNKQGWKYAFVTEQDYNLFTDLLTNFFEYKSYTIPETTIKLKRACKTKVAKALGDIHKELSNENSLTNDNEYFKIIKVLSHFKEETKEDIYKALTR